MSPAPAAAETIGGTIGISQGSSTEESRSSTSGCAALPVRIDDVIRPRPGVRAHSDIAGAGAKMPVR
jgi:hypothetical protein